MKTLPQYLLEKTCIAGGFLIPRSAMPQIEDPIAFASMFDGYTDMGDVDPEQFKPLQMEYDEEKVDSMIIDGYLDSASPIVVSSDNYVIDGHHRYFAHVRINMPIRAIKIHNTANQILAQAIGHGRH